MHLPDMSGIVLAQRIREELRWSPVCVLLMSADPTTPQIETVASRLGGVGIIRKPFTTPQLRAAIEQLTLESSHAETSASFAPLRVLIVDDSGIAQKNVKRVLSEFGFTDFTLADDGAAAVEKLRHESFDLIVTDYNMPRMDGLQLVTHIRRQSQRPNVPVIMVTTEHDPRKLMEVYQLGVTAICNKSFDRELVRNILVQLFL
jgi:two-component system chemotaxis response regulator CheY